MFSALILLVWCIYFSYFAGAVIVTALLYLKYGFLKLNMGKTFYIWMALILLVLPILTQYPRKYNFRRINRFIVLNFLKNTPHYRGTFPLIEEIQNTGFKFGWICSLIATPILFSKHYGYLLNF